MINIAVDGFTGSGKSSLVKLIAKELNLNLLDTGAIFRGFACAYDSKGLGEMTDKVIDKFLKEVEISVVFIDGQQHILADGKDVTGDLRTEKISQMASKISVFPQVRDRYLEIAKKFAKENDCIMEGRDIGTVVMPDADVKIFLTADEKIRAKRRYDELIAKGMEAYLDEVLKDLQERDLRDTTKKVGALMPTAESIIVDNSDMDLEHTAQHCIELIKQKIGTEKHINIAIDGYVCSGKSTIAKELAKRLGIKVFDTGAIYRGIACAFDYMKLDESKIDEKYIEDFARQINVQVRFMDGAQHVFVNGIDHTQFLRTERTSALSAKISPFTCIRDKVLKLQRDFAKDNDLVMEGRDIGSFVLPNADYKFFCTADENVRAKRRWEQQRRMGDNVEFENVLKELKERDFKDIHRKHGAIVKTDDAIVIDTTNQNVFQSVEFCLKYIKK